MSAIFGLFNLDGRPAGAEELSRMREALAADGPDGGDVWVDRTVGLGQRLMRFTPEDAFERQPLSGCGAKAVLVADARIDNRPELTETFRLGQAEAAVLPDSAFIMKAYEKWGQECVHHLIGDFSFAVWDARSESLFAARSPMGQRPLHYYADSRRFAFASMPRGLHALPGIPRVLNEDKVVDELVRIPGEPTATYYENVFRLLPGHCLRVGRTGLVVRDYYRLDLKRRIHYSKDDDYVEAFLAIFDRVVSDSLRSVTPAGVFMSGGLDSSSIAVTAATLATERRLHAYTEVPRDGFDGALPPGRYADETPFVQAIARRHQNIDLNLVQTEGLHFLEGAEKFFHHAEMPFPNAANKMWWEEILRRAAGNDVRVLLTGVQGNITASWTGSNLLPELLRSGKWRRALNEATARRSGGGSACRTLTSQGIVPLLPSPILKMVQRFRNGTPSLQETVLHPALADGRDLQRRFQRDWDTVRSRSTVEMRYWLLARHDLGVIVDAGYRSQFGVDTRTPLADARIAEFCLALPEEQCRRDGQTAWLIRRAMGDRLPVEILGNRLRGLQCADWLECMEGGRRQIEDELEQMAHSDLVSRMIDVQKMRRLWNARPQHGASVSTETMGEYRSTFQRGLMMGRFLRWMETESQAKAFGLMPTRQVPVRHSMP